MKKGEHPNSRANLALGAKKRNQGKEEHCITVLPETWAWLITGKNASARVDEVVGKITRGEMVGIQVHQKALEEIASLKRLETVGRLCSGELVSRHDLEAAQAKIGKLEAQIERLKAENFKLKRINGQLIIKTPVEVLAEVEAIVTRLEAQSKEGEGVGSAIASA